MKYNHEVKAATPDSEGESHCPICSGHMHAVCGERNAWHWRHLSRDVGEECEAIVKRLDPFSIQVAQALREGGAEVGFHKEAQSAIEEGGGAVEVPVDRYRVDGAHGNLIFEIVHSLHWPPEIPANEGFDGQRREYYRQKQLAFTASGKTAIWIWNADSRHVSSSASKTAYEWPATGAYRRLLKPVPDALTHMLYELGGLQIAMGKRRTGGTPFVLVMRKGIPAWLPGGAETIGLAERIYFGATYRLGDNIADWLPKEDHPEAVREELQAQEERDRRKREAKEMERQARARRRAHAHVEEIRCEPTVQEATQRELHDLYAENPEAVSQLLAKFGAAKVRDLKPGDYAEVRKLIPMARLF